MSKAPNFEVVVYVYVCHNPIYIPKVEHDFFKDEHIQTIYRITRDFYGAYKSVIFDTESKDTSQFSQYLLMNIDKYVLYKEKSKEDNVRILRSFLDNMLTTNHKQWSAQYLESTIKAWIEWENSTKGYKLAMEYRSTADISPANIKGVINKCKQIINQRSTILWDDEESLDFYDPSSHEQVSVTDLIDSGYPGMNKFLCGDPNGGFYRGTVTLLLGESNIGKSTWLGNIATNVALGGVNVMVISLEMSVQKLYKRMGANAYDIDIDNYTAISQDKARMGNIIKTRLEVLSDGFRPIGALRGKKFTRATVSSIREFVRMEEARLGIEFPFIVLDYFTELENDYGVSMENSYIYHKQNSNDLFCYAGEENKAIVSAHQLNGSGYGADDIHLTQMSESKGIIHRVDNIFGLIQPPDMRIECEYMLKSLKLRDSVYKDHLIKYKSDPTRMRLVELGDLIPPNHINVTG